MLVSTKAVLPFISFIPVEFPVCGVDAYGGKVRWSKFSFFGPGMNDRGWFQFHNDRNRGRRWYTIPVFGGDHNGTTLDYGLK
jgi:hypothetical protein